MLTFERYACLLIRQVAYRERFVELSWALDQYEPIEMWKERK